jgi:hypothetical protein
VDDEAVAVLEDEPGPANCCAPAPCPDCWPEPVEVRVDELEGGRAVGVGSSRTRAAQRSLGHPSQLSKEQTGSVRTRQRQPWLSPPLSQ